MFLVLLSLNCLYVFELSIRSFFFLSPLCHPPLFEIGTMSASEYTPKFAPFFSFVSDLERVCFMIVFASAGLTSVRQELHLQ